jgi:hypothetical protein
MPLKKNESLCLKCQTNQASNSAIVAGTYYKFICESCANSSILVSSGDARWSRSIDMEDNEAAVQQPYNSDGTINTRFAKLYPKQAKALFTDKQLRDANR